MTRLEDDFVVLDRAHDDAHGPARGADDVFDGATASVAARRRRARMLSAAGLVLVALAGGVALTSGGDGDDETQVDVGAASEGDGGDTDGAGPSDPQPTTTRAPTTVPAGEATRGQLVDVRISAQGGADQVVFQLVEGSDELVAAATVTPTAAPPTGECDPATVELDGAGFLAVRLPADTTADPEGVPPALAGPLAYDESRQITAVEITCAFEGVAVAAIGLVQPDAPFAVQRLSNPPRLLVEVYPR